MERAEQGGHRRLSEHLLWQVAVVQRCELRAYLVDHGVTRCAVRHRAQRKADPEGHERRSCNSEDDRPPHDPASLSDPPSKR